MERRLLFISADMQNFIIRNITQNLTKAGYSVISAPPELHFIRETEAEAQPTIFLIYLDGYVEKYAELLSYIRGILVQSKEDHFLYLIGTDAEINSAYKYVQMELVSFAFKRPVNVADLIRQLNLSSADSDYSEKNMRIPGTIASFRKRNILIVDDDTMYLHTIEHWFSNDFNVYTANSGMNAIAFLKKHHVDLVLLDYEMPVITGLEVFQVLKTEPTTADIPVIFLTAKDDRNTIMEVMAAKPANYLLKTQPPILLLQSIKDFFTQKKKQA